MIDQKLRLEKIFAKDDRGGAQIEKMIQLMVLFAELPPPPDPEGLFPDYGSLKENYLESINGADPDIVEEKFMELYCHLHGHEAPYTASERKTVDRTGGYWCHAGGISPILKAGDWINKDTVLADFGAGNGLQALLFQKLYPHKLTVQIEISSRMVNAGRKLQNWLGIPKDKVRWVTGDVRDTSPKEFDFIYLYRPLKPVGVGVEFYKWFARELEGSKKEVVIFSIADCLKDYLSSNFEIFYNDGHLTCFKGDCTGS